MSGHRSENQDCWEVVMVSVPHEAVWDRYGKRPEYDPIKGPHTVLFEYLRDGWEPFAVISQGPNVQMQYHLRRKHSGRHSAEQAT